MLGYHYEHHETVSLGLASDLHFDLYVSVGENTETNEYHHDFMMKNVDGPLVLDAKMIPAMRKHEGFTVAVFMHGLDERENTLLKGKLTVQFEIEEHEHHEEHHEDEDEDHDEHHGKHYHEHHHSHRHHHDK